MDFNQFFPTKAYFKMCIEAQKVWLPFFPCQSLLLSILYLMRYNCLILTTETFYHIQRIAIHV